MDKHCVSSDIERTEKEEVMEEHKVGEIFQFEGKTLKCVKSVDNYCLKCALRSHILCDEHCARMKEVIIKTLYLLK